MATKLYPLVFDEITIAPNPILLPPRNIKDMSFDPDGNPGVPIDILRRYVLTNDPCDLGMTKAVPPQNLVTSPDGKARSLSYEDIFLIPDPFNPKVPFDTMDFVGARIHTVDGRTRIVVFVTDHLVGGIYETAQSIVLIVFSQEAPSTEERQAPIEFISSDELINNVTINLSLFRHAEFCAYNTPIFVTDPPSFSNRSIFDFRVQDSNGRPRFLITTRARF